MLDKLKGLLWRNIHLSEKTPCSSRGVKRTTGSYQISEPIVSSRDVSPSSSWGASFEGFRHMMKDLSRRLEAIREDPGETYLINTELTLRLLGVLESLAGLTERNTVALERLTGQKPAITQELLDSDKKKRAREVLGVLERAGPLTYEELRKALNPPITYNRVTALVSEMIRDGIPLKREGKPVVVSVEVPLTGSK